MIGVFLAALDQTVVGHGPAADHHRPQRQRPLHVGVHRLPADVDHQRPALRQAVGPASAAGRSSCSASACSWSARCWPGCRRRCGSSSPRAASRVSAPARCSPSRWPSSATCSRRPSAASTRACSGPSSACRVLDRAGHRRPHHRHTSAGTGCSSSTCRSVPLVLSRWSGATCRPTTSAASARGSTTSARPCSPPPSCPSSSASPTSRPREWTDPTRRRAHRARRAHPGRLRLSSSRAPTSRSCRSSLFRHPLVHGVGRGGLPGRLRLLRGGRLPAALVPGRGRHSATESGYQILPLLGGLIFSAVASGQIVSRTGRYRMLIFGALVDDGGRAVHAEPPARRHAASRSCGPGCS